MEDNTEDRDAARDDGHGRVEQQLMAAAHVPNVALAGAGRVLPRE
jgi:hypothetical protein